MRKQRGIMANDKKKNLWLKENDEQRQGKIAL